MKARLLVARAALVIGVLLCAAAAAGAAEIKVMSSAGFKAAYLELAAEFERATGHKIVNAWGPSMGGTPQAVPNRIARGEPVDVVIVVGEALDKLIKDGKVVASSRSDLARSLIGAAVRAGAPKPDIGSVEAFKQDARESAVDRLFRQRQRRLYRDRALQKARCLRRDQGQEQNDSGGASRRDRGARRCRAWFPADERALADKGHRRFGADPAGNPKGHGVLRGPRRQLRRSQKLVLP